MHLYFVQLSLQKFVRTFFLVLPPGHLHLVPRFKSLQLGLQADDLGLQGGSISFLLFDLLGLPRHCHNTLDCQQEAKCWREPGKW